MIRRHLTILSALLLWVCPHYADAVVWTVSNTDSTGSGSLRAAIDSANAGAPAVLDTITFAIPGAGPHVLSRRSTLLVTAPGLFIDGYSQPGASANTLDTGNNAVLKIVLTTDTTNVGGLVVESDRCRIRGLVLGGLVIALGFQSGRHGVVEGNYIGVDAAGTSAFGNELGVFLVGSDSSRVGGALPAQRNIISACSNSGIYVAGGTGVIVTGNYVGTDRHGTSELPNIAGIFTQFTTAMTIGGTMLGGGNLVSGNIWGIYLTNSTAGVSIEGNLIGTDASGLFSLGNDAANVYLDSSSHNTIGGPSPSARNIIAGSPTRNLWIVGGSDSNQVIGNFIGTDRTGLVALSNNMGIDLANDVFGNRIGGESPAHRNVIAGHASYAIRMGDTAVGNVVLGNYIGLGADGTTALGNGGGVLFDNYAGGNTVGLPDPLTGNTIAYSSLFGGVVVSGTVQCFNNALFSNSFHDNVGPGIDLGGDGVTANDTLDIDFGPNDFMNYPVLTSATHLDTGILLEGTMMGTPGLNCVLQVFQSATCDATGHGEGQVPIEAFFVDLDPVFGLAPFSVFFDTVFPVGTVLTATATDNSGGSTSEFSECVTLQPQAVGDTLKMFLFSPVSMVVTDPMGDSIGIDSASGVIFNTILSASSYDTTSDVNSPGLSGPDGSEDDIVTIPNPLAGEYDVRLFVSDTSGSTSFTMAIRINGNQLLVPDDYDEQSITALGNTVDPVFVWTAATTLPGDANADGIFAAGDIIYLVNYVFKSGPATPVPGHGDANCSGTVTSADIIHMVNFVFKSGQPPCSQSGG